MQGVLHQLAGTKKAFAALARAACFNFNVIDRPSARLNFLDDFAVSNAFADADVHGLTIVLMRMIVNSIRITCHALAQCFSRLAEPVRPFKLGLLEGHA